MTSSNLWQYNIGQEDWSDDRLVGYKIAAEDGDIGKIDEATTETGAQCVVVDTGPWILGKKVMLPAGLITSVDHAEEKVYVARTKDQIKDAPEFDADMPEADRPTFRDKLTGYYSPMR